MEQELEAVKKITDVLLKFWQQLSPDTRIWLKAMLAKMPDGKQVVDDVDRERV